MMKAMMKTRIFQNAVCTPSGYILCSRNEKEISSYKDPIDGEIYTIAGGIKNPVMKVPDKKTDLFENLCLSELSSVEEIKNKLVWRTYGSDKQEEKIPENFRFRKLKDLSTAHLEAIVVSRSISNLHRFIIGILLQERTDTSWLRDKKAKVYKYKSIEENIKL